MTAYRASNAEGSTAVELCRRGADLLCEGKPDGAAKAFREAIEAGEMQGDQLSQAQIEAHHGLVRALREAGRLEQSVGAALALTALTPKDPRAHSELAMSLQRAGHQSQAEAAAAGARILEWKMQLQSSEPPAHSSDGEAEP